MPHELCLLSIRCAQQTEGQAMSRLGSASDNKAYESRGEPRKKHFVSKRVRCDLPLLRHCYPKCVPVGEAVGTSIYMLEMSK